MVPKKSAELIVHTAKVLDQDINLVKDFTSFYWSEIRKALVDMKDINIYVDNLGTFKAKTWKVAELQQKYEDILEHYARTEQAKMSFLKCTIQKEIEAKLIKVKNLAKIIEAAQEKKQSVKQRRNDYNNDIKSSLEE